MHVKILVCGFIVLLFIACHTEEFRVKRSMNTFFSKQQSNDTLYFRDYFLENTTVNNYRIFIYFGTRENKERLTYRDMDTLAIFESFKTALFALNLPIKHVEGGNTIPVDSLMTSQYIFYDKICHKTIKNIAQSISTTNRVLVPVISFYNVYGTAPDLYGVEYRKTLTLSMYIVENNQIVYYSSKSLYNSVYTDDYDLKTGKGGFDSIFGKEMQTKVGQKQWDRIVREVMEEYIKVVNTVN